MTYTGKTAYYSTPYTPLNRTISLNDDIKELRMTNTLVYLITCILAGIGTGYFLFLGMLACLGLPQMGPMVLLIGLIILFVDYTIVTAI